MRIVMTRFKGLRLACVVTVVTAQGIWLFQFLSNMSHNAKANTMMLVKEVHELAESMTNLCTDGNENLTLIAIYIFNL